MSDECLSRFRTLHSSPSTGAHSKALQGTCLFAHTPHVFVRAYPARVCLRIPRTCLFAHTPHAMQSQGGMKECRICQHVARQHLNAGPLLHGAHARQYTKTMCSGSFQLTAMRLEQAGQDMYGQHMVVASSHLRVLQPQHAQQMLQRGALVPVHLHTHKRTHTCYTHTCYT